MKVFISWSGDISHRIAMVFRDWLPSVIQSIIPYVSSADIDKGARWSTDISQELQDSTFGLLCVTKANMEASWLSFEAGALSKTVDKSLVTPFLFDIRRSEVKGPLLQFQSTIFEKEDLRKLIFTLNKACPATAIEEARLDKAFEVWYPTLEQNLNEIMALRVNPEEPKRRESTIADIAAMAEETLELTRSSQKLLRNSEAKLAGSSDELQRLIQDSFDKLEKDTDTESRWRFRKIPPVVFESLLRLEGKTGSYLGFYIILSLFKSDCPWIYDLGKELISLLKSDSPRELKIEAVTEFKDMVEQSFGHLLMIELHEGRKEGMSPIRPFLSTAIRHLDSTISSLSAI